ncbi:hypothetical protein BsWGS_20499 [Bradybaena similaris]
MTSAQTGEVLDYDIAQTGQVLDYDFSTNWTDFRPRLRHKLGRFWTMTSAQTRQILGHGVSTNWTYSRSWLQHHGFSTN